MSVLLGSLLFACGEPPAPEASEEDRRAAEAELREQLAQSAPSPAADQQPEGEMPPAGEVTVSVPLDFTWVGVGTLYQQFFQDEDATLGLSEALGPWIRSMAQLQIRYEETESRGQIVLIVPPGAWAQTLDRGERSLDLQRLAPVTAALASYRDAIAANYDLRVQSLFGIYIELYRGSTVCRILPAGEHPPTGEIVSPCVEVQGLRRCGAVSPQGQIQFEPSDWSEVKVCFQDLD